MRIATSTAPILKSGVDMVVERGYVGWNEEGPLIRRTSCGSALRVIHHIRFATQMRSVLLNHGYKVWL